MHQGCLDTVCPKEKCPAQTKSMVTTTVETASLAVVPMITTGNQPTDGSDMPKVISHSSVGSGDIHQLINPTVSDSVLPVLTPSDVSPRQTCLNPSASVFTPDCDLKTLLFLCL